MKYKINSWIVLCLIFFVLLFVQAGAFTADLQEQDKIIAELQAPQQERITLTEPITLIRTSDDYIYLKELEIDKQQWESATKHTDINGITWWEVMQDGYIKVYVKGHVLPDDVHWYAPY